MKRTLFLLSLLLLTSCVSESPMLYMGRSADRVAYNAVDVKADWGSILTTSQQTKVTRYLQQRTIRPVQIVGGQGSVNSFKEYAKNQSLEFPNALTTYCLTQGEVVEGMEAKDVWLSKGSPAAVFVTDEFVTWRYKDDSLVVFVQGKTVKVSE